MNFVFNQDQQGIIGSIHYKYYLCDVSLPLVITFSPGGRGLDSNRISKGINPWGFDYIYKNGYNILSFEYSKSNRNYYRDNIFLEALEEIGEALPDFPERLSYGASMGGYAATAFANPLKVDRILAINVISSRKRDIAIWDYEAGRSLHSFDHDWSGKYTDGAETNAAGYIVYDPLYDLDKLHAIRYKGLKLLRVPGLGHLITGPLKELGMLTWLVGSFIKDDLNEADFYQKSRVRRHHKRYYTWMLSKENNRLTPMRRRILKERYLKIQQDLYSGKKDPMIYKGFYKKPSRADIIRMRDTAVSLEDIDIQAAYQLMTLALKYRPKGPFMQRKVKEYAEIINSPSS